MFVSLLLYISNKFIDGKKVESAHQISKNQQTRHNNHRMLFKRLASTSCFRRLSLLYLFNRGRWGSRLQYSLGPSARSLMDPDYPSKPHELIAKWIIKPFPLQSPKIEVTLFYAQRLLKQPFWISVLHDEYTHELIHMLRNHHNIPTLSVADIKGNSNWKIKRIKCFRFHQGSQSFAMNFAKVKRGVQSKCVVRCNGNIVMRFQLAIQVEYMEQDPVWLCKGEFWPVRKSTNADDWLYDFYSSMDSVNAEQKKHGWNFMTNIEEPVFLIHNCVTFAQVRRSLPEFAKELNKYDYLENMIYWHNRLVEYQNCHHDHPMDMPCGPVYICKQHQRQCCTQCITHNSRYSQRKFNMEWCCNNHTNPHSWIFDKKNGLVMTLMQTTHRWKE